MKTLFICSDFPPMISGIARSLYHFWSRLPAEDIIVLAPKVNGWREFDRQQRFQIVRYATSISASITFRLLNCIMLLARSLSIVFRVKIKGLHCGQPISAGLVGLLFRKLFGIPYCLYVYGGETAKYQKYIVVVPILRLILKSARRIIVNSEFTRKEFQGYGIEAEHLIKVTPGVDIERFRPDIDVDSLKRRYHLEGKKVLLTVARLSERKGHDMAIRVLTRVLSRFPDLIYIIVGQGPQEKRLKQLVKEEAVQDHVLFAGSISEEDLPSYYLASDVFLMPNRQTEGEETFEGFGTSFIEASACAKPVIAGRSGGVEDAVVDGVTGILVDPLNKDEIAQVLIRLLSDEAYAKSLGVQGRARVEQQFRWDMLAQKIQELL
jgi:phosphatidylinositol alpha-1,6-mannosyltransferase